MKVRVVECRDCRLAQRKCGNLPGAVTLCWTCGALYLFNEDLVARAISTAEPPALVMESPVWPRVQKLSQAIQRRLAKIRAEIAAEVTGNRPLLGCQ